MLGTALVVLPQSCLAAPNTVRTAPDVARSLWGKGLRSDEDLARWEAAVASDCVYYLHKVCFLNKVDAFGVLLFLFYDAKCSP